MSMIGRWLKGGRSNLVGLVFAWSALSGSSQTWASSCSVAGEHAGIPFPVERIASAWICRLQFVIDRHLTASTVGPFRTAMDESMYLHLLDRPPSAAALINRLDLAEYKAEERGSGRWWGNDGEGTEGIVHLVYDDRTTRVYYLEGTHHNRLLPKLSGKAVVFLRMRPVKESSGLDAMESTMVAYAMLDHRGLSGLVSLLRPLIGSTVAHKLTKGVEVVNRLGLEMRQRPERVLFEAIDPPPLPEQDVAFLKEALSGRQGVPDHPRSSAQQRP